MLSLALLSLVLAVQGAPSLKRGSVPDDQDCIASIPADPNPDVVNAIYRAAVAMGASTLVLEATFETCLQESNCNNLSCGDQDSVGAFQQRPSQGWGSIEQIMNVTYSAGKFLELAIPLAKQDPGAAPDKIAQGVQRAEAGNLYAQHLDQARKLIQQAQAATGGGGGSEPSPTKTSGDEAPTSTPTDDGGDDEDCDDDEGSSTTAAPTPTPTSDGDGDDDCDDDDEGSSSTPAPTSDTPAPTTDNSTPAPTPTGSDSGSGSCSGKTVTPVSGDSCWSVAQAAGVDLADFMAKNPSIDSDCSNLQVGVAYCL